MKTVTFNGWVGQDPESLRENLIDLARLLHQPTVINLQEAWRFNGSIPGYERHAFEGGHRDNGNNVQLIRKRGVHILHDHMVEPEGPWWKGPKHGQDHPPRKFPGVTIEEDGDIAVVLDIHRIPNERRNPRAAQHEWLALTQFANSRKVDRALIMEGDWNARRHDARLRSFARGTSSRIHIIGIDGPLARDCRPTTQRKLRGKFGSDGHRPVVTTWRIQ